MMPEIERDTVTADIIYDADLLLTKEQQQYKTESTINHRNNRKLNLTMAASATPDQRDLVATPVNNYVYRSPLTIPPTNYRYDHMYNNNIMAALSTQQQQQYMTAAAAAAAAPGLTGGVGVPVGMDLGSKEKLAHLLKLRESPVYQHYVQQQQQHQHQQQLNMHMDERTNVGTTPATNFLQKTLESPRSAFYNGNVAVAHPNATASAPPPQIAILSPPLLPPPPRSKTPHPRRTTHTPPAPPAPPAPLNQQPPITATQHTNKTHANANANIDEIKQTHKFTCDMTSPATWHPHVYGRPPNRPTPHGICDILGLRANENNAKHAFATKNKSTTIATATTKTTNNDGGGIAVLIDESSNSSSSVANQPLTPAKSPKSILRTFQQQLVPPTFDMRSTSASDASEEDLHVGNSQNVCNNTTARINTDMSDQPLNLCVAKKPRLVNHVTSAQVIKNNAINNVAHNLTSETSGERIKLLGKTSRKGECLQKRNKIKYINQLISL